MWPISKYYFGISLEWLRETTHTDEILIGCLLNKNTYSHCCSSLIDSTCLFDGMVTVTEILITSLDLRINFGVAQLDINWINIKSYHSHIYIYIYMNNHKDYHWHFYFMGITARCGNNYSCVFLSYLILTITKGLRIYHTFTNAHLKYTVIQKEVRGSVIPWVVCTLGN
jgi:hypothetical protein